MNISLINAQYNLIKAFPLGRFIVEYYSDPENGNLLEIQIYDPEKNRSFDVAPELKKPDLIEVVNCIWNSQYLFFPACEKTQEDQLKISIYRYNPVSRISQLMFSLVRYPKILEDRNRIKFFILNETTILFQTETYHEEISGNMIGNIEFALTLLRTDSEEETNVADFNFINNGINLITAISDNRIMVKTGYSWLEDSRMSDSQSSGAFIESVYVTTTSKFIADLTIASDSIDMPLVESTYRDRHIIRPRVTGIYTHYTITGNADNESKCVAHVE